jgi:hypothetical protein
MFILLVVSQNVEVKIHNGEDLIIGDLVQLAILPLHLFQRHRGPRYGTRAASQLYVGLSLKTVH